MIRGRSSERPATGARGAVRRGEDLGRQVARPGRRRGGGAAAVLGDPVEPERSAGERRMRPAGAGGRSRGIGR